MKCPTCNVTLLLSEKQGVDVVYCPQCKGVWLDKGKLERIVDKTHAIVSPRHEQYFSESLPYERHNNQRPAEHSKKREVFDFFY